MTDTDEKTIVDMIEYFAGCWNNAPMGGEAQRMFKRYIDTLRSVSQQEPAVPIVRCRECQFYRKENHECFLHNVKEVNGFCSWAVRKKEKTDE